MCLVSATMPVICVRQLGISLHAHILALLRCGVYLKHVMKLDVFAAEVQGFGLHCWLLALSLVSHMTLLQPNPFQQHDLQLYSTLSLLSCGIGMRTPRSASDPQTSMA